MVSTATEMAQSRRLRVKPEVQNLSSLLSKHDARNFRQGMRAADHRQWDKVDRYLNRISDPTAKKIIMWKQAADDSAVPFSTLTDVVQNQAGLAAYDSY